MHQTPLIAAIFLLFLALAVSGLAIPIHPHARHVGHHRIHRMYHRHPFTPMSGTVTPGGEGKSGDRPGAGAQQGTPATPHIPVPRAKPQNPVRVPVRQQPLPEEVFNITGPAKMFGWDPRKVMGGCGADCDMEKYLRRQEFLIAHNWVRVLFKLPFFTWDEKLESAAGQYALVRAEDCKTTHSNLPYGENIFWGLYLHWTPSDVVYSWFNESHWYDFKSLTCSAPPDNSCGHFTQLVWKDSVRVGCALQHCRDPTKGMLVFCEYDPPGNYGNENPLEDNNAKHRF